jgi:tRNA A37 threonylcarbamoyladenosine dehydratase
LIEPSTKAEQIDMIDRWEKVTNLMKRIDAYFVDNKEKLKIKIQEAIWWQNKEIDSIKEDQFARLAKMRSLL